MSAKKQSAGILLYRLTDKNFHEVFLVHPGGPYWAKKDAGAWSIPKGEFDEDEDPLKCAVREFGEETGQHISGNFLALKPLKQKSGKIIHAWALEGNADAEKNQSNLFEMEWPPKSGVMKKFPEADRAAWFSFQEAREKIVPGQIGFINELEDILRQKS